MKDVAAILKIVLVQNFVLLNKLHCIWREYVSMTSKATPFSFELFFLACWGSTKNNYIFRPYYGWGHGSRHLPSQVLPKISILVGSKHEV